MARSFGRLKLARPLPIATKIRSGPRILPAAPTTGPNCQPFGFLGILTECHLLSVPSQASAGGVGLNGTAGNAPCGRGFCLILRKIGTSIDSRAYSHQNSPAIATREAAELWSLGTPQPGLTNDASSLGNTSKADTMITTTGVLSRRSMLPPATAIPIPVAGGDALLSHTAVPNSGRVV
jgi:hypothetical protein